MQCGLKIRATHFIHSRSFAAPKAKRVVGQKHCAQRAASRFFPRRLAYVGTVQVKELAAARARPGLIIMRPRRRTREKALFLARTIECTRKVNDSGERVGQSGLRADLWCSFVWRLNAVVRLWELKNNAKLLIRYEILM